MWLCTYSDDCNIKQSLRMNFTPFLLLLCQTAVRFLQLCTLIATLCQLLHNSVLQAILFSRVAMHDK